MLLTILLIFMAIAATIAAIVVLVGGGAIGIVLFGDVIVCVLFIAWIISKIIKKHKKD